MNQGLNQIMKCTQDFCEFEYLSRFLVVFRYLSEILKDFFSRCERYFGAIYSNNTVSDSVLIQQIFRNIDFW